MRSRSGATRASTCSRASSSSRSAPAAASTRVARLGERLLARDARLDRARRAPGAPPESDRRRARSSSCATSASARSICWSMTLHRVVDLGDLRAHSRSPKSASCASRSACCTARALLGERASRPRCSACARARSALAAPRRSRRRCARSVASAARRALRCRASASAAISLELGARSARCARGSAPRACASFSCSICGVVARLLRCAPISLRAPLERRVALGVAAPSALLERRSRRRRAARRARAQRASQRPRSPPAARAARRLPHRARGSSRV